MNFNRNNLKIQTKNFGLKIEKSQGASLLAPKSLGPSFFPILSSIFFSFDFSSYYG